jgi:hypothetical protein
MMITLVSIPYYLLATIDGVLIVCWIMVVYLGACMHALHACRTYLRQRGAARPAVSQESGGPGSRGHYSMRKLTVTCKAGMKWHDSDRDSCIILTQLVGGFNPPSWRQVGGHGGATTDELGYARSV